MRLFTGTARASHHPWQQPEEANGRALLAAGVGLRRYPMIIVVPRCTSPSKTQSPPSSLAGMLTTRGPIRFEADPERAACAHLKGDGGASRPLRSERTLPHAAVACQHCSGDLVCTSQKRHAVFFFDRFCDGYCKLLVLASRAIRAWSSISNRCGEWSGRKTSAIPKYHCSRNFPKMVFDFNCWEGLSPNPRWTPRLKGRIPSNLYYAPCCQIMESLLAAGPAVPEALTQRAFWAKIPG